MEWIDAKEQEIPKNKRILVTTKRSNSFAHNPKIGIVIVKYDKIYHKWYTANRTGFQKNEILAWMLLPEPYEPQESDDKE